MSVLLILPSMGLTMTEVGGPIRVDTTWFLSESPYIIVQNIRVDENVTLTIEPGVRIEFHEKTDQALDENFNISVEGELIAQGTKDHPIVFTSAKQEPQPGDWDYIEFKENAVGAVYNDEGEYQSGSVFEHVSIEYGGGSDDRGKFAVHVDHKSPYFSHVIFQKNRNGGLYLSNVDDVFIDQCQFLENNNMTKDDYGYYSYYYGGAIYVESSANITVNESRFVENNGSNGGAIYSNALLNVNNSTFILNSASNNGGAIFAQKLLTLDHCTFVRNSASQGGGAILGGGLLEVKNCTFTGNFARNSGGAIFNNAGSASFTVNDSTFKGNSSQNGGAIYSYYATSLTVDHCVFIGNQSEYEGASIYSPRYYYSGNKCEVTNTLIYQNYGTSALTFNGESRVDRSTIVNNYSPIDSKDRWDGISAGNPMTISNSNIYGHDRYEIMNPHDAEIDAINNYWGSTDEMEINVKIFDVFDNSSKGEVNYYPYLDSFATDAPSLPDPEIILLAPLSFELKSAESSDETTLAWCTVGIEPSESIVISMKRDSIAESITEPDNINWYCFTDHGADGLNDGTETITIPDGLAEADDWRFYIHNVDGNVYGASDACFRYMDTPDTVIFSQEIYDYGDWIQVTLPPNPEAYIQYIAMQLPHQETLYFFTDLNTAVPSAYSPWEGDEKEDVFSLQLYYYLEGLQGAYTFYLLRIPQDALDNMDAWRLGISTFRITE